MSAKHMKGHEPRGRDGEFDLDTYLWTTGCECGWTESWPDATDRPATARHAVHVAEMADELRRFHRDYYQRTSHCGLCGQPGTFCLCTDKDPCGCRGLHRMGSGLDADPIDVFAATPVVDGQEELFQ